MKSNKYAIVNLLLTTWIKEFRRITPANKMEKSICLGVTSKMTKCGGKINMVPFILKVYCFNIFKMNHIYFAIYILDLINTFLKKSCADLKKKMLSEKIDIIYMNCHY